jgi:hypothetical protein
MHKCLFVGPSVDFRLMPSSIHVFGPAQLGSIYRAVESGYKTIGLIDSFFGNVPTPWHKELLFAMWYGVEVYGAASMGAIRAAELCRYGMKGVGRIFQAYRLGILTDDDEVCVLHSNQEFGFSPLTYPMINIRYTLRAMRKRQLLDWDKGRRIANQLKSLHFGERDMESINRVFEDLCVSQLFPAFQTLYVDMKRSDAVVLAEKIACTSGARTRPDWIFPKTLHWIKQFEKNMVDLPTLGPILNASTSTPGSIGTLNNTLTRRTRD